MSTKTTQPAPADFSFRPDSYWVKRYLCDLRSTVVQTICLVNICCKYIGS